MDISTLIKVTNELPKQFIIGFVKECADKLKKEQNEQNEMELEAACNSYLIKRLLQKEGLNKVLKDCTNISSLNKHFSNEN